MRKWRLDNRGYTLIELVTVMAMLAILMTIMVPTYSGLREDSVKAVCNANVATLNREIRYGIAGGKIKLVHNDATGENFVNKDNVRSYLSDTYKTSANCTFTGNDLQLVEKSDSLSGDFLCWYVCKDHGGYDESEHLRNQYIERLFDSWFTNMDDDPYFKKDKWQKFSGFLSKSSVNNTDARIYHLIQLTKDAEGNTLPMVDSENFSLYVNRGKITEAMYIPDRNVSLNKKQMEALGFTVDHGIEKDFRAYRAYYYVFDSETGEYTVKDCYVEQDKELGPIVDYHSKPNYVFWLNP